MTDTAAVLAATHYWVQTMVVGLNLCPFAALPLRQGGIRYRVHDDGAHWEETFLQELDHLQQHPDVATTLLIVPALADFTHYLDAVALAEAIVADVGLEGVFQVASFHPQYQFADSEPEAVGNYTNRSPYPVLHLLREAEISRAVDRHPDPERIYQDNIRRLESLGEARVLALLAACHEPPIEP